MPSVKLGCGFRDKPSQRFTLLGGKKISTVKDDQGRTLGFSAIAMQPNDDRELNGNGETGMAAPTERFVVNVNGTAPQKKVCSQKPVLSIVNWY